MWHPFAGTFGELGDTGDRVCRFRALSLVALAQDSKNWEAEPAKRILELLSKGKEPEILNASELTELEALVLRVSSDSFLGEWRTYLENDYRVLFGLAAPKEPTDATQKRAAVIALSGIVQRLRAVRRSLGLMRSIVCLLALAFASAFFLYGSSYLGLWNGRDDWKPLTVVIALTGALAGFISGTSRLYSLDWSGDLLLSTQSVPLLGVGVGLNLLFSVLEGGVFATILYVIFAAGFLQGSFFPTFQLDGSTVATWATFVHGGPAHGADFAKAIVWAFVAGFSERVVPDLLGQLAGSATLKPADSNKPAPSTK